MNAIVKYKITGDPSVKKEAYIKYNLILLDGMLSMRPKYAHTPNMLHSIAFLKRCCLVWWAFLIMLFTTTASNLVKTLFCRHREINRS